MPEAQLGSHTVKSHGFKVARTHRHDWIILLLLVVIDVVLNKIEPFHRFIGEGMMGDMMYPLKNNTVPLWAVPIIAVLFPILVFLIYYVYNQDVYDLHHAILGILYSGLLTGVITDAIKDAVGRPRPNFFYRCFPNGNATFNPVTKDVQCYGEKAVIKEGYKSFPSGHTSWSFAGLVFLSWYLSGKIKVFDRRGHIAKLCIVISPLLLAALIGVSRVDDYWHHWQDVFAGALIGIVISSFCYLQFFPYPNDVNGWAPHAYFEMLEERNGLPMASRRLNTVQMGQSVVASRMGTENNSESGEITSSDSYPVLDAMETGRRH